MNNELTLIEHLSELRRRIIICILALGIGGAVAFPYVTDLLRCLKYPASGLIDKLAFFSPQEALGVYFKIALACALILAMPVILYQLWAFISPAIEPKFKRFGLNFVIASLCAFVAGGAFAYFVIIPKTLAFLLGFAKEDLVPVISINRYISFIIGLILGSGLVFEMPVASFVLTKCGLLSARFLRRKYKFAVLFVFITAAIITPTADVFNLLLLAVPMLFLYEVSIWVSFLAKGPRKRDSNNMKITNHQDTITKQ